MGVGLAVVTLPILLMQGVFGKTWDVKLPSKIVGISGSCVTVPCLFEVPDNHETNILNCSDGGVWRRGRLAGPDVFTARSPDTNTIQGSIDGDLTRKNCTTTFSSFPEDDNDVYFFRLDCWGHTKFTFKTGVNISVQPGVSAPLLIHRGQLSEGDEVWLQCSVPVPCTILPPSIFWLPHDSSMQKHTQIQQNKDGQMMKTSTLTFIASADHHNQTISCIVSYPLTQGVSIQPFPATHTLDILYAPNLTVATLSTCGPVYEGCIVTFTCSSDANPPVSLYTWYRVDTGQLTKRGEGEILILKVSQNDSGVYLCEAQNQRGSQRSRPVSLEINATTGSSDSVVVLPYIICGVVLVLYILTLIVGVCKYQSLSRRLKQIELKGEHTYTDLRICSVTSDYDQLQLRQPKTMPPPDGPYENLQT